MKRILQALLIFTFFSSTVYAEVEDSPVDNKSTYHISENIDLISAHDIQYEKPKIMIKLVFPRLSTSNGSSEEVVKKNVDENNDPDSEAFVANEVVTSSDSVNAFNEQITQIIKEEIGYFKDKVADANSYQATLDKAKVKNRLTIDYNSAVINLEDDPLVSIRFVIHGYVTGMPHPYRRYRTLNFDLDSAKPIQLSELFDAESNYLEALAYFAHADLSKKIRADAMLSSGAAPTKENYSNWNINPSGIRITFDESTVAPYSYGSQTVLIPYAALKDFINPESPLGRCLAHRKRCMREPLLTGGFIDEAVNTKHRRLDPTFG